MELIKAISKKSLYLWTPVFKKTWPWLVFSLGVSALLDALVGFIVGDGQSPEASQLRLGLMMMSLALQLLLSALVMIIVNNGCQAVEMNRTSSVLERFTEFFKYIVIETARALPVILLRFLLLIIPGIIESIRLYFIPYIVMFDAEYQADRVDALERSREVVRGHFWVTLFVLILLMAASMLGRFAMMRLWDVSLYAFSLGFFGALCIELWTYTAAYSFYIELAARRGKNGNSISLSGTSKS